ncbi:hypothetical protein R69919_03009 [Paraburkholderia gardini]|uniref:Uncharacterized protein n=1 Tax=Paraburkholderia gardini TaxID=2823469 RepID=A0ABN7QUA9_9BURK|nr:hypothetical protein R69919_03009 [Paraburkholderia gardini]CAG4910130.1 hypothetical protein R54767_03662 [Paraburkholderia gardini]
MSSDPSAESTDKPLDPTQPSSGTTRKTGSPGSSNPAKDDLPDADAAEPVPHEHLPVRSDDN